jgi:hypothetical protein
MPLLSFVDLASCFSKQIYIAFKLHNMVTVGLLLFANVEGPKSLSPLSKGKN